MSIELIFKIGAGLVVIAGILGGVYGGYSKKRSAENLDANEAIDIKDKVLSTLRGEIADLRKTIEDQEKRIKDLELTNASYVKLFQGNPSQLETYMRDTASSMHDLANAMATVLSLMQTHPPATSVTINK